MCKIVMPGDSHLSQLCIQVLPITDDETGDQVSYHKDASDDVASGFDVNIGVTRTHSVEVVVPPGITS